MTYDAVFFDLDGTLVDTEVLWLEAIRLAMAERGADLSPDAAEALVYGKSWADIFAEIQRTWPGMWSDIKDMEPVTEKHFVQLRETREVEIPNSVALLKALGTRGMVAIVSGSTNENIAKHIVELGIGSYVDFYHGCESYSPGKPDPACYFMAARTAKVDPSRCLVFEDSYVGVQSAKAAGMTCIAIQRPDAPRQDVSAADRIVADLSEVAEEVLAAFGTA